MSEHADEFEGRPELVKKRARHIFFRRLLWSILASYLLVSSVIMTYNAVTSIKAKGVLLDCTQPSGKCFQRGQARTAVYIQHLIDSNHSGDVQTRQVSVYAAICSSRPQNAGNALLIKKCIRVQQNKDKQ